ncbi:hypothetical protein D922_01541 [Enterococcus faecalis 06-MB-DW-09]|jgi:hypothetical protein|nr:hypothetical protein D922_01541 [Enterococcus faecalis 06-MB-DW-09]
MENPINKFSTARMTFDLFVSARDWSWMGFRSNPKNPDQYLGQCMDQSGTEYYFLITQDGKYYRLLGNKKFEPYEYVYQPKLDEEPRDDATPTDY